MRCMYEKLCALTCLAGSVVSHNTVLPLDVVLPPVLHIFYYFTGGDVKWRGKMEEYQQYMQCSPVCICVFGARRLLVLFNYKSGGVVVCVMT